MPGSLCHSPYMRGTFIDQLDPDNITLKWPAHHGDLSSPNPLEHRSYINTRVRPLRLVSCVSDGSGGRPRNLHLETQHHVSATISVSSTLWPFSAPCEVQRTPCPLVHARTPARVACAQCRGGTSGVRRYTSNQGFVGWKAERTSSIIIIIIIIIGLTSSGWKAACVPVAHDSCCPCLRIAHDLAWKRDAVCLETPCWVC